MLKNIRIILFAAGLLVSIVGIALSQSITQEKVKGLALIAETDYITVDLSGAVNQPGVFTLPKESRVYELLAMADGFDNHADFEYINKEFNLSTQLKDSQKLFIPFVKSGVQVPESQVSKNQSDIKNELISINTASAATLDSLPGIGLATAEKIIDGRPYAKLDELLEISGISESKFAEISKLISL